jgi:hypothetical protein
MTITSWFSARAISFEQFATLLSRTIRRPVERPAEN